MFRTDLAAEVAASAESASEPAPASSKTDSMQACAELGAQSCTTVRVPFYDTDAMGIVHHSNYLRYFELGRVEWFRARGMGPETWTGTGLNLAVVDSRVRYKSAARFDQCLVVQTSLAEVQRVMVRFRYAVLDQADGRLVAEGETVHACVDEGIRPRRLPPHVRSALLSIEQASQ